MWLMLIVFILTILYYLIQRQYNYWSKNGIPGPRPIPFVGNFGKSYIGKKNAGEIITDIYRMYEEYPVVGIYKSLTPVLLIRDPELMKNILVKDFKHFQDNDFYVDKELEPLLGRHPFVLKGAEWKQKRASLTYCFTSGKIKAMYVFLQKNADRMNQYIKDESKKSICLESREICVRYTLDNIGACAFGIEAKCFESSKADFRDLANKFLSPDSMSKLGFILFTISPKLLSLLKIKILPAEVEERLFGIVRSSIKYRKDNNIVRNDFLDAMIQISKDDAHFSETDIVANTASFFGDGYETSSRVMSFLLFELARHPEVQKKLREEINAALAKNGNQFSYELVTELTYLDACLNESMRKNSIIYQSNKVCTEDYTYTSENSDFKPLTLRIKAGTSIIIPSMALENDPKYFEDPDKFMPERFLSKLNKASVHIPFGTGPRNCLGQRFGTTQVKVGVANIIKNFELSFNAKTVFPLKFDPYYIMPDPVGGLWIDFNEII